MKPASLLFAATAALVVSTTACEGLKEAMTAHVDTVARAGNEELSVDRVSQLMDESKLPPRREIASAVADAWTDYMSLAVVAAKGDTAVDTKQVDEALWGPVAAIKARKYYEQVSQSWGTADTAAARRMYANGDILAASHILLLTQGMPDQLKAAQKSKAAALRAQANASNFAELARTNSQDRASAQRGGSLGLFPKGAMVPEFQNALLALKPGEISPVIETSYGYHIIRRPTYDEVKNDVVQASKGKSMQAAESVFVANMMTSGKIDVHNDAIGTARAVIQDPAAHRKDNTTLATYTLGKFTAGELAKWLGTFPPMQVAQQRAQLEKAPDSVIVSFEKNFITNDLVLHAADSLHLGPTPQEMQQLRTSFLRARDASWAQLGIDPKTLADSGGKTAAEREQFAAKRIARYMDRLVTGQAQFIQVAGPVSQVMRERADATVNPAGLDRAVEKSKKAFMAADSARRAGQPTSAVPLPAGPAGPAGAQPGATPGAPTGTTPQGAAPPGAAPAGAGPAGSPPQPTNP